MNLDRVLEDRNLTEELLGREERRSKGEKLRTTFDYLFRNFFRGLFKRFKRYGYAVVSFGKPISIDAFIREHPDVLALKFEDRKDDLQKLADVVMTEISNRGPRREQPEQIGRDRRRHRTSTSMLRAISSPTIVTRS